MIATIRFNRINFDVNLALYKAKAPIILFGNISNIPRHENISTISLEVVLVPSTLGSDKTLIRLVPSVSSNQSLLNSYFPSSVIW